MAGPVAEVTGDSRVGSLGLSQNLHGENEAPPWLPLPSHPESHPGAEV